MTTPPFASRLQKAARFLRSARILLAADDPESAISRAYYAVYHSAIALLEAKAGLVRRRWDHTELYRVFVETFCRRGFLFDARDGAGFADAQRYRVQADYTTSEIPYKLAERVIVRSDALVKKIRQVLYEGQ